MITNASWLHLQYRWNRNQIEQIESSEKLKNYLGMIRATNTDIFELLVRAPLTTR